LTPEEIVDLVIGKSKVSKTWGYVYLSFEDRQYLIETIKKVIK
jgi:hypothetical protein